MASQHSVSWVLLNESSSLTLNSLSNQTYEWHHLCIQWRKFILQKIYVNNQIGRYAVHFAVHLKNNNLKVSHQLELNLLKKNCIEESNYVFVWNGVLRLNFLNWKKCAHRYVFTKIVLQISKWQGKWTISAILYRMAFVSDFCKAI